jgi:hypothetical protein
MPVLVSAQEAATDNSNAAAAAARSAAPQAEVQGSVARAIFTSAIVDREPVDELTDITTDLPRLYFFTDLRDLAGQIITHRWEYNGQVMAEIKFKVGGGPRWRVYSSKNLLPDWTGKWTVSVIDQNGQVLNNSSFEYRTAMKGDSTTSN